MVEEILLEGCKQNDATAQQELYHKYSPKMLSVCYRYAKTREDAEDMLQEGFIKVFTQIHQFEARGSLEGWILRIMVHTSINHLKKNKRFNENIDLLHAEGIGISEDYIPATIQAKQVVECIRALPIGYRTVLNLYAIEGYSHREIGEILDIEESTSRSQFTRAKNLLESILVKKNIISEPLTVKNWFTPAKNKIGTI